MASQAIPHLGDVQDDEEEEAAMLDPAEAGEEIPSDPDAPMDSDPEDGEGEGADLEIQLQNDSSAHFDAHTSSIFCIAAHPVHPEIIATGGGDDVAFVFDSTAESPLLPASYQSAPLAAAAERESLTPLAKLDGHKDSVNALQFSLPSGEYLISGGLDGQLRVYADSSGAGQAWVFIAAAQEVEEVNWVLACPDPNHPNHFAMGASDGSVWVYSITPAAPHLTITQAYYLHTASCTAGAWSPDGTTMVTVGEDASLYAWDVFSASGAQSPSVSLTSSDARFAVDGGLFSVAISPTGTYAAAGGAGGAIRVISLPHDSKAEPKSKSKGKTKNKSTASGEILACLQVQSDVVESLAFSPAPAPYLASGSVDGSVAVFDTQHEFRLRRQIPGAHGEYAVVRVEFAPNGQTLTSAGMDGVVRRWNMRGGAGLGEGHGLVSELRGHRGEGEGGGVLGFVHSRGRIVTAGDDGVSLVFVP